MIDLNHRNEWFETSQCFLMFLGSECLLVKSLRLQAHGKDCYRKY